MTLMYCMYFRCEALNSANELRPVSSRIHFNVFFPPKSLKIQLERPENRDPDQWDRTETFKKSKKFDDNFHRIVLAGELIQLVCIAGKKKNDSILKQGF